MSDKMEDKLFQNKKSEKNKINCKKRLEKSLSL
jgi:hypothetical protein